MITLIDIFFVVAVTLAFIAGCYLVLRLLSLVVLPSSRPSSPAVFNVEKFGARLEWKQVQDTLRNRGMDPLYRAVGQIAEAQRQRCQHAVQDKSNLPEGQTAFEAGGAAALSDLMLILAELDAGKCQDPALKRFFGE